MEKKIIPGMVLGQILTEIREPQPFFASKEAAKTYLEGRITKRRNDFITEYKNDFRGTNVLTYEPALDREVYKELRQHRILHPDAYQDMLQMLRGYTRCQIETFIGERLTVGLSKFRYDMRFTSDGVGILYGQGMTDNLIEMISRGKDCRNEIGADIDHPRQVAEVTQFEKIQEALGDPKAKLGTTVISFSPPGKEGSSYAHNFYDMFILREDKTGERYVEARRYASGLSIDESLQKAEHLQPGYTEELPLEENHIDAFLISRPLVIQKGHEFFNKPDELHKALQGKKDAMSHEEFGNKVLKDKVFSGMVDYYIHTLETDPENTSILRRTLDALMNRADEAAGLRNPVGQTRWGRYYMGPSIPLPIIAQINMYGAHEVRQTDTGCGFSGGLGQESRFRSYGSSRMPGNMSPFKSTDGVSGEDKYGKRTFECPECHETNVRPYEELLPKCQHCGSEKVAC